jgi:hypothetical protein
MRADHRTDRRTDPRMDQPDPAQMSGSDEALPEDLQRARADRADIQDSARRDRMNRAGTQPEHGAATAWQDLKSRFVDDPAGALAAAEDLVQRTVDDRIRAVKDEAAAICAHGDSSEDPSSTEALRTRLLRYQKFCERLASTSIH